MNGDSWFYKIACQHRHTDAKVNWTLVKDIPACMYAEKLFYSKIPVMMANSIWSHSRWATKKKCSRLLYLVNIPEIKRYCTCHLQTPAQHGGLFFLEADRLPTEWHYGHFLWIFGDAKESNDSYTRCYKESIHNMSGCCKLLGVEPCSPGCPGTMQHWSG